jgi:NAD(P)-dependent dehydrogenase (short-subunit alcohol dehydrogenase family)
MDTSTLFSLAGRTALITGGSEGIGRMIAAGFIAQGAKVYICSRKAESCAETARSLGDACIALPHDLGSAAGYTALAAALLECEPTLDILVNNAGIAWAEDFDAFTENGWDRVMQLNVKAPFFLTQKLHGALRAAATPGRPAKVINIGSVDGMRLNNWETYSYHASKAAIHHLTRRMAARLIRDHINVTAIAPGAFPSRMNRAARERGDKVALAIPAGRVGLPEDMAAAAIYLASRAGDYVIGETLTVDGGLTHAALGASIDG